MFQKSFALAIAAAAALSTLPAFGASVDVPPDRTIAACRQVGSEEQCRCYWERATSGMDLNEKWVFERYAIIQVKYLRLRKDLLHQYVVSHPAEEGVGVGAEAMRIGLVAGEQQKEAEDRLAGIVSARLFQSAVTGHGNGSWS